MTPPTVARDTDTGLPPDVEETIVTVGTFDGMHRGHQDLLRRLVARGTEAGLPTLLVTFEPHPLEIVNPSAAPPLLTQRHEKLEVLAESGIDYVAVLPFNASLAAYDAEAFVDHVLRARYRMGELLVGHDHGFGRGRMGDITVLRDLGQRHAFSVDVLDAVHTADGLPVSSTAIRRAVAGGDLRKAREGLGRAYSLTGRVVGGDQRGRLLGYPTLNIDPPPTRKLLPPDGVYAVRAHTPHGDFGGMLNLGPRPTFGDPARRIEAHVFDVAHDWYGASVRIDFVASLRETRAFASVDALVSQLAIDERHARSALAAETTEVSPS